MENGLLCYYWMLAALIFTPFYQHQARRNGELEQ